MIGDWDVEPSPAFLQQLVDGRWVSQPVSVVKEKPAAEVIFVDPLVRIGRTSQGIPVYGRRQSRTV